MDGKKLEEDVDARTICSTQMTKNGGRKRRVVGKIGIRANVQR